MKTKYSFVCDAANISQTGNLNVLGIFNNINAIQFPVVYPKLTYVANIEFHRSEVGRHLFKMNFINDDGAEVIPSLNGEIHVNADNLHANILVDINNVNFPSPGVYAIDLVVDNIHLSSDCINVTKVNQ